MEEADAAIQKEEDPIELILFKADNLLEEILLRTQLRIQVAKNQLISNLSSDIDDINELADMEQNISEVKDKMDTVTVTLEGKVAAEKKELNEKYGDN